MSGESFPFMTGATSGAAPQDSRFIKLANNAVIDEHSSPGTFAGNLTVFNDTLPPNVYTFTLDNNDGGRFAISLLMQLIVGLTDIEFDEGATRTVVVRAHTSGLPDITAAFSINIREIILIPPTIYPTAIFPTGVPDSVPVGTVLYDLMVTTLVNFTWSEGEDVDGKFEIQGDHIVLSETLDFSLAPSHSYTVNVTDDDTGIVYTTTIIVPVVADTPQELVLTPQPGFEQGVLFETLAIPTLLGTLSIVPPLTGYTYSIVTNSAGNLFGLTGNQLNLVHSVDFETLTDHAITLRASNGVSSIDLTIDFVVAPGPPLAIRYIAKVAAGTQTGDSVANAAPLSKLNSMIAGTLAGGQIRLLTDAGDYTLGAEIKISVGGAVGSPKLIAGYTAAGVPAVMTGIGNRTDWTLPGDPETVTDTRGWAKGANFLRLNTGANNLTFRDILVKRVQFGCRMASIPNLSNLTFDNFSGYNIRRLIEDDVSSVFTLTIARPNVVGCSREAIRLSHNTNNVLIEDPDINCGRQSGDPYSAGISLIDTVHDVIIRGSNPAFPGRIRNAHDGQEANGGVGYWNGDSISAEGTNYNIHLQDLVLSGNTDSGCDLKSASTTLLRVVCEDNKRNFRLWGTTSNPALQDHTLIDCVSNDPNVRGGTTGLRPTHMGIYAPTPDIWIENFIANDSDASAYMFDSETNTAIIRYVSYTYNGLGTLKDNPVGCIEYDPVDMSDVTAPVITTSLTRTVDENLALAFQLAATDVGTVTYRAISGDKQITVTRDGAVALPAQDFEAPQDSNHDNVYTKVIWARDQKRNKAIGNMAATVLDVAGDTGGNVSLGTTFGWRWSATDREATVQTTGTEKKLATKTTGSAHAIQRGTVPFFPPLHRLTYFEVVPTVIGTAASFAVGLANASAARTSALGANLHSIGYFANGAVVLNGVTLATLSTYAANDVIGIATDIGHYDWDEIIADPLNRVHDWKKRLVWFYKNGTLVSSAGGIDISALIDPLFGAVDLHDTNDAAVLRSTSTEWTQTPRSGHAAWGLVQQRVVSGFSARYIVAGGTGTGMSWADPAPLSAINSLIASVRIGSTDPHIFLKADGAGFTQSSPITISQGGLDPANRVTIIGVTTDLIPHPVRITGSRTAWTLPSNPATTTRQTDNWDAGEQLFTVTAGARNLTFSHIYSTRHEEIIYCDRAFDSVTLEDSSYYNNRRGLVESIQAEYNAGGENPNVGGYAGTSVTNFLVRRCFGTGDSKPCFHLRSKSNGNTIEDCQFNGGLQQDDQWSNGPKFSEVAHDNIVQRVWVQNMKESGAIGHYIQGDGIEGGSNPRIHINHCVVAYNGDAGIDSKSDGAIETRNLSYLNRRGFKHWGDGCDTIDGISYVGGGTGTTVAEFAGHDGSPGRVFYHNFHAIGSIAVLDLEGYHQTVRFIDGIWHKDDGSTAALSTMPINLQENTNSRWLFAPSSDVTPPVITSANSASVFDGQKLSRPLSADSQGTWGLQSGVYTYQAAKGTVKDPAFRFQIINYNAQNPTLTMNGDLPAAFDSVTPANNTPSCTLVFTDAAGNTTTQVFTLTIAGSYTFLDTDAQAFCARLGSPSNAQKQSIDNKIIALKAQGIWAKAITIQDFTVSLLDWKGVHDATLIGAPALNPATGYTCTGAGDGIDTNVPNSDLPQNGGWFAFYDRGSAALNSAWRAIADAGDTLDPLTGSGHVQFKIHQTGASTSSGSGGAGFFTVNRSAAGATQLYKDGGARVVDSSPNQASIAPTATTFKLGSGAAGITKVSFFAAGLSSLTASQLLNLSAIMKPATPP